MNQELQFENMNLYTLVLGPVRTNCYVLLNTKTKEAVIVDPADRAGDITGFLKEKGVTLQAILLTHGHFDHIMGAAALAQEHHVKIYANLKEKELLARSDMNYSDTLGLEYGMEPDEFFTDGTVFQFAGFSIQTIDTPGHTAGGTCFYLKEQNILFSGDTLFRDTIGRTDLPTGSFSTLLSSVKGKLMQLPDEVQVFPGHGAVTSIGYERVNNEYLNEEKLWE